MQQPNENKKKTSWELQQEKLKAEKDAKLKKLLEQEKPVYKKKTTDEKIAEKRAQENTKTVQKDNTNVRGYNNAEKFSKESRNKTDKEVAEERQSRMDVQVKANEQPFDWSNFRQSLADRSQATGDALRVSNEPNFFDDYLNPAAMIGSMADNLGQAPLQAQQTDSYMPYVTAVGTPLAVGAMAGIGTQNTGQFVNNLANPLAGTGDLVNNLGNKYLPNAYKLNPYAFKASEDMGYRMLGKEGYQDAIESGVLRAKPTPNQPVSGGISLARNTNRNPNTGKMQGALDRPYFADGFIDERYAADYMAAVNKADNNLVPIPTHKGIAPSQAGSIPLDNAIIYKKDWLQGYKQVDNSVSNPLIPLYRNVQRQEEPKKFAIGGNLQQQNNNNMLTEFNVGNSHENNPLGGIPQGMGSNGVINTVEEGETKKDSFIYSNRITLTPQVIAQFNLPKSLVGKTAADATKLINNKFEGRNSKIDNNTKKAFLDRIAEAQETVKAEEQAKIQEAMQINSTEVPDMMNGQVPQGMEEFTQPQRQMFGGGFMNSVIGQGFGENTTDEQKSNALGAGLGVATTAFNLGNTAFGKSGIDTSGATDVDPGSVKPGMMGVTSALKGAQAGSMFGPIGTGVGAAIGLGSGLIGGGRAKKDALRAHQNFEIGQSNSKISNFALGGNLLGEPITGEPKLPVKKTPAPVVVSKDNLQNLNVQPLTDNEKPSTSKLKGAIVELQNGSNKDGIPGQWVYYKKRSTPGFNPETDRDFVYDKNSKNLTDTYEYHTFMNERRKAVEKNRAILNTNIQLTQPLSLNNTTAFRMGGNMYEGGGELKPWQLPSSKMTDDPNFNGGFEFKNMTGAPYATELPLDQQINVKYTPERGKFYKQSFNQMGRPQISNDLGYTSKLNYNDPDTINLSPEQLQENNGYRYPENAPSRIFGPQATGHYEGEMYDGSKVGKIASKVGQYVKDNYGNALRYAPVAMNAYQLSKMGKPEVETLDRLGNRYNPQYMDEKALTNQINAETNYTANALANASNGSLGSLSNNILGMQLNKTKALSDAYSKVADVNRNEDKTAQQFNLGVDQANIGQSNMEKDINARNRGAFKTERSKLLGQIGNDLGNIGKETVYKKLAKEAFGYTYDGEYVRDDKGKVVNNPDTGKPMTKEDLEKTKKYAQQFKMMSQKDFGSLSLNNKNTKE